MESSKPKRAADPWWLQYPAVQARPESRGPEHVERLMKDSSKMAGRDYAVIDVRGTDKEGGHVKDSFSYRAQDFYPQVDSFGEQFKHVPEVFFYCSSSNGRGPRVAGWYQDWLNSHNIHTSRALILTGGIKSWVLRNAQDPAMMTDYDPIAAQAAK